MSLQVALPGFVAVIGFKERKQLQRGSQRSYVQACTAGAGQTGGVIDREGMTQAGVDDQEKAAILAHELTPQQWIQTSAAARWPSRP